MPKSTGRNSVSYFRHEEDDSLTPAQQAVYDKIIELFQANQYMPTMKELADALGCYPNSVQCKIVILEEKGYISRHQSKSRSMKFTKLKVELVAA